MNWQDWVVDQYLVPTTTACSALTVLSRVLDADDWKLLHTCTVSWARAQHKNRVDMESVNAGVSLLMVMRELAVRVMEKAHQWAAGIAETEVAS